MTERGRVRERAQRVALKFASNFAFAAVASRVSRKASASILMAAMSLAKQRAEGYLVNARRRQRRLRRQRRRRQRRTSFACIYFHFRLWPRTWQTTPHTYTPPFPLLVPCTANAYNVLLLKGSGGEGEVGARHTKLLPPRAFCIFLFCFRFAQVYF